MRHISIYRCGETVKTKNGGVEGMITCSSIRFDRVQYEISYFLLGDQKTIWMHEEEFTIASKKTVSIGFKQ